MARATISCLALCACGAASVPPTPPVASSAPPPVAPPVSAEKEWHRFKPAPTVGGDPRPLYEWVNAVVGSCSVHHTKQAAFLACGASLARFDQTRLDFESFRDLPLGGNVPAEVHGSWPDDLWIKTVPPTMEHLPPDAHATQIHMQAGKLTTYRTSYAPAPYRNGYLVHVEQEGTHLPKLAGVGVDGPDFSPLERQLAWPEPAHANEWGYALDPKGPVWVLVRALDLATKKKAIGVLRWAPGETARFDRLPAPFDKGERSIYVTEGKADGDRVSFAVTTPPDNLIHLTQAEAKREQDWIVRYDGKKWSATRKPDVTSGASAHEEEDSDVAGYRTEHGRLMVRAPDGTYGMPAATAEMTGTLELLGSDALFNAQSMLFVTRQPDEVVTLTDAWGTPHPWPAPAADDCHHPFAVVEVLERQSDYDAIAKAVKARPSIGWGKLPEKLARVPLVETRVFGRIVIGASFKTMDEATTFAKDATPAFQSVTLAQSRGGTGIYCVHPIDPKPFVAP